MEKLAYVIDKKTGHIQKSQADEGWALVLVVDDIPQYYELQGNESLIYDEVETASELLQTHEKARWDGKRWVGENPKPIEPETDEEKRSRLQSELKEIDSQTVRPSRAIHVATLSDEEPDQDDVAKIKELEDRAEEIREELHSLA